MRNLTNQNKNTRRGTLLLSLLFIPGISIFADNAGSSQEVAREVTYVGLSPLAFWSMIAVVVFLLVLIAVLIFIIRNLIQPDEKEVQSSLKTAPVKEEPSFLERINDSVSLEKEKDILMDHNYDGIRELDNNLPPWWIYGFYLTIVVAFGYLIHYHITQTGDLPLAEYKNDMKAAEAEQAEFRKKSTNLVDEHTVVQLKDATSLAAAKELFVANCAACHLPDGGGIVGPNLTDDYWLHGGSIQDVFKTIKFGYPEKGMKSWKDDFSAVQIAQLASYVKSLRGTHPAVPKDPQGELYTEQGSASTGSVKADSNQVKQDLPVK